MRTTIKRSLAGAAALAALGLGGATYVQASSDDDASVTGPRANAAKSAALKITNGGTVNAVERDSEQGAVWEVEVTKPDGSTVDVRLSNSYGLVATDGDNEADDKGDADGE